MPSRQFRDARAYPQGIARERERASYRPVLIIGGDRPFIGFLPEAESLTCLGYVRIFSMALRPETDPNETRCFAKWLGDNLEGLDAIYCSETDPQPTCPNVVPLRAA